MRNILVDYARRNTAAKRNHGAAFAELDEAISVSPQPVRSWPSLIDALLSRLAELSPRQAQVAENARFFGGLTEEEIAIALGKRTNEPSNATGWWRVRGCTNSSRTIEPSCRSTSEYHHAGRATMAARNRSLRPICFGAAILRPRLSIPSQTLRFGSPCAIFGSTTFAPGHRII